MINGSGWSFINDTFVNITFLFSSLNPTVLIYRKIIESNGSYYSFIKGKIVVHNHLVHTDFFWMCETCFWHFGPFQILVHTNYEKQIENLYSLHTTFPLFALHTLYPSNFLPPNITIFPHSMISHLC